MLTFIIGFITATSIGFLFMGLPKHKLNAKYNMDPAVRDIWRRDGSDRKERVQITEDQRN